MTLFETIFRAISSDILDLQRMN